MDVIVCMYAVHGPGGSHSALAEVFSSVGAYNDWLIDQIMWPEIQYIDGTGNSMRLITNFSDDTWSEYVIRFRKVID